jgi:2',3'-cyclic-nucleotide 2'-phosphodiesterase (5'-nucleotidase family)
VSQENLTILHTNDIHGNYTLTTDKSPEDGMKSTFGGFETIQYHVEKIRKEENANVLLLDAGDFMTGNPICDIEYQGVKGGPMVQFFNAIGYEGMTLGNHEFDISVENARALIGLADFPVVNANVFTNDNALFADKAYHIYEKNGLRVGVIGITVHDLGEYLSDKQRSKIHTKPALEIVEKTAAEIDDKTDLIIVLSHSGIGIDRQLAEQLSDRVDIIVGGHSHTRLNKPSLVNNKIIVQAGSRSQYLGRLDVSVADDKVESYKGRLIFLDAKDAEMDPQLAGETKKYKDMITEMYGKVIGELKTMWVRSRRSESNIGNFITDAMREKTESDFAVVNSGGIRKGLIPGPIKAIDIKEILPFSNTLCVFEMTGEQVMNLVTNNARGAANRSFGILQVSGLAYKWHKELGGDVVLRDVMVNGQPIDINKTYKGTTVDYVLANASRYLGIESLEFENTYIPLTDVIIDAVREAGTVSSSVDGRIAKSE